MDVQGKAKFQVLHLLFQQFAREFDSREKTQEPAPLFRSIEARKRPVPPQLFRVQLGRAKLTPKRQTSICRELRHKDRGKSKTTLKQSFLVRKKIKRARFLEFTQRILKRFHDMSRIFMTPEQIGGMRLLNPPTKEVFLESRDFFSAVKRGKVLAVERMLERNESLVLDYDSQGMTGLHWASKLGNTRVVKILLQYKPDCQAVDRFQMTPLVLAVLHKRFQITVLLLLEGASPFVIRKHYLNPVDNNAGLAAARLLMKAYMLGLFLPSRDRHAPVEQVRSLFRTTPIQSLQQKLSCPSGLFRAAH